LERGAEVSYIGVGEAGVGEEEEVRAGGRNGGN
jgi:hypothetical protein